MTQGEHLSKLLKARGLSINRAAARAGISRENLNLVALDKRGLGPKVAAKLAPVLEVTVEELRLPKEQEVETRRGFDRRLRQLANELDLWKGLLHEALTLLELQVDLEADPGSRVSRRTPRQRPAGDHRA